MNALELITRERIRQGEIDGKGYTDRHDDVEHRLGELADAGARMEAERRPDSKSCQSGGVDCSRDRSAVAEVRGVMNAR